MNKIYLENVYQFISSCHPKFGLNLSITHRRPFSKVICYGFLIFCNDYSTFLSFFLELNLQLHSNLICFYPLESSAISPLLQSMHFYWTDTQPISSLLQLNPSQQYYGPHSLNHFVKAFPKIFRVPEALRDQQFQHLPLEQTSRGRKNLKEECSSKTSYS